MYYNILVITYGKYSPSHIYVDIFYEKKITICAILPHWIDIPSINSVTGDVKSRWDGITIFP